MLRKWRDMDEPGVRDRCRNIAKKRIKEHEYSLPEEALKEINRIYKKAEEYFVE